jgi:hypothetical protein
MLKITTKSRSEIGPHNFVKAKLIVGAPKFRFEGIL